MIRVLQVFGGLDCGGAQTMLLNVYDNVNKNEIQFDFVKHTSKNCYHDDKIINSGGKIYSCPRYKVINHFGYKRWWKKFFIEHPEYRVVHSHVRSTASIILKVAKKLGRTTISHSHSTSNGRGIAALIKKILQRNIPKYSDYCFGCSKESGEWLFGESVVKTERFKVIPNAIDVSKFIFNEEKRLSLREELGLSDSFVVGHVGRFCSVKNHSFIIDVFCELIKVKKEAKLLLVGEGELKAEIEEKARALGLADEVKFLGVRSDVGDILNTLDCFLFPSIWEGLPVSLIEAQANGLPIVMSDSITDDIVLAQNVVKENLSAEKSSWVDKIIDSKRIDCKEVKRKIKQAGYDINNSAKELQELYCKLDTLCSVEKDKGKTKA